MGNCGVMEYRLRIVAMFLVFILEVRCCHFVNSEGLPSSTKLQDIDFEFSGVHCSRPRSRAARAILDDYLFPFLEQEGYNLSTNCRLHSANDMFFEQEQEKDSIRPSQWQCGYCKKMFRSEEFLDKHFDNRHHDKIDSNPQRCLADVCGAIHCDHVLSEGKISLRKRCYPAAVERNKHYCETLAKSCFPPEESDQALKLHEFFLHQFCGTHSCKPGQKHYPRGSAYSKNRSLFFALSLFTIILLMIFYVAIYLYRKDLSMTASNLKRLAKHSVMKSQSSKKQ